MGSNRRIKITKGGRNGFEERVPAKINSGNILPNSVKRKERGSLAINFPSTEINFSVLREGGEKGKNESKGTTGK